MRFYAAMTMNSGAPPAGGARNGRVKLDVIAQQASIDGQPIYLTPIEFKLLFIMMSNAGKVMPKNDMFFEVWGYEFIGGTNLVGDRAPPAQRRWSQTRPSRLIF